MRDVLAHIGHRLIAVELGAAVIALSECVAILPAVIAARVGLGPSAALLLMIPAAAAAAILGTAALRLPRLIWRG
jgi:hypothetical protein